jgi:hypothetical protein
MAMDVTPYVNTGAAVLALYLLGRIGTALARIATALEAKGKPEPEPEPSNGNPYEWAHGEGGNA